MKQDAYNSSSIEEEERHAASQSTPAGPSSTAASLKEEAAYWALSVPVLAAQCLREIDNYRRGEPWTDEYGLELLRRALSQEDQVARVWMQNCFSGLVRSWLCRHPKVEVACRLESEETYVAQAFKRFWQVSTLTKRVEFNSLAAALQYLRARLNGAILDTLRTYARPGEVSLPEPGEPGVSYMEVLTNSSEMWEILQMMLIDEREQRLAYLHFHCGLKSREIVHFCSQEWSDVREIYRLRRNILERLLHDADQLRSRLSQGS